MAETLDKWVKDGKHVKRFDIISCVNQLRKFKKFKHAAQVFIDVLLDFDLCAFRENREDIK